LTVLSICQDVSDALSLTRPSAVVTSTDQLTRQLFSLLKEGAEELSKYGGQDGDTGWQALTAEWTFVTVAQVEQTNTPIPEDFRRFIPDSAFNRTTNRQVTGPLTPQQWQRAQVLPYIVAPYLVFRERQSDFLILPDPPTAGETIAYEYISSYWAKSSANVAKATFTSDDDSTYLDEALLKLDLKWRFKQAKGLDYAEDMATFERAKQAGYGSDGGSQMLDAGGPNLAAPAWRYNVPEGSWPS
jgi:hypothetical protein